MTISLVFSLIGVAAAIVAIFLAKRTQLEARKAAEGAAIVGQRLDDLYRAAAQAQINPERAPKLDSSSDGG